MKERLKKIASFIFNLKFGIAIIFLCIMYIACVMIKDIYNSFRSHFSEVVYTFKFWFIFIFSILAVGWIVDIISNRKKPRFNYFKMRLVRYIIWANYRFINHDFTSKSTTTFLLLGCD